MSIVKASTQQKLIIIAVSMCLISLPAYLYLFGEKEKKTIVLKTLIQKTSGEVLSPRFFSDYLCLSPGGRSLILKRLDLGKIANKLKQFPIFKYVEVKLTSQGELQIAYDLRKPAVLLSDYTHCGVDEDGAIVPLVPFYSPKKLPEVFFGIDHLKWHQKLNVREALEIVEFFDKNTSGQFQVKLIDISNLSHKLPSHREIIITISVFDKDHYLRVNPLIIGKALTRYLRLFTEINLMPQLKQSLIFDARIMKFATLKQVKPKS